MSTLLRSIIAIVIIFILAALRDLYLIIITDKEGLIGTLSALSVLIGAFIWLIFNSSKKATDMFGRRPIKAVEKKEVERSDQSGWDTIQIVRMTRDNETNCQNTKSWLGGLPAINLAEWPRNPESGEPLHHIAHVDLTELPQCTNMPKLPRDGTISFFIDTALESDDIAAAIVYTPANQTFLPCPPPNDCPPVHGENWAYYQKSAPNKADAARSFRRWPIEFFGISSGNDAIKFGPTPSSTQILSESVTKGWVAKEHISKIGLSGVPWKALIDFRIYLQRAIEKDPAEYKEIDEVVERLAEKLLTSAMHYEASSLIGPGNEEVKAQIAELRSLTDRVQLGSAPTISPLDDAILAAYREMHNSSQEVQSRIPESILEYLRWERVNDIPSSQYPWQAVYKLMNSYKLSLSGYANRDRSAEELQPARDMITKWWSLAREHDQYSAIGSVVETLENEMEQLQKECKIYSEYSRSSSAALRAAASDVYIDMMVDSRDVSEQVPGSIRSYIDRNRRRSAWNGESEGNAVHSMFGQFQMVQSSADEFGNNIPLLQLQSDEMMGWCWGDVGSIAIGISPKDLAEARWDKTWGLFQGH